MKESKPTPKRRRAAIISIRLTPEEHERLRKAAKERNTTLSTHIRHLALQKAAAQQQIYVGTSITAVNPPGTHLEWQIQPDGRSLYFFG